MQKRVQTTTLDVFDTVLFRACGSPLSMHLCVGRRLLSDRVLECMPETFARLRAEAEQRAFRNNGGLDSDVDLKAIYADLAWTMGLDATTRDRAMAIELACERDLMRHPKAAASVVESAGQGRFAFVSDMYLNEEQIRGFLSAANVATGDAPLYVSSAHSASKRSGKLYAHVAKEFVGAGASATHIGNDAESDFNQARKARYRARFFNEGNYNRYESILEQHTFATGGLAGAFAGASRLARLDTPVSSKMDEGVRDFAASVAGPVVAGMALWAMRVARREGRRRIYFCARDGQIVLDAARILNERLRWGMDLRYVYASRQAWLGPSIGPATRDLLDATVATDDTQVTTRMALARLGLEPDVISDVLHRHGFVATKWDNPLGGDGSRRLLAALKEDEAFAAICRQAEIARQPLTRYLQQEGMFDGESFAFFDLGTKLSLYRCLATLLPSWSESAPGPRYMGAPPLALYMARTKSAYPAGDGTVHVWHSDDQVKTGFRGMPTLTTLMELICCANHGTTFGYRMGDDGMAEPIIDPEGGADALPWNYEVYRSTVLKFAEELVVDPSYVDATADVRPALYEVCARFWQDPTKLDAQAIGAIPFEDGWGKHTTARPLAARYSVLDLAKAMVRPSSLRRWRLEWLAGSLRLTPGLSNVPGLLRSYGKEGLKRKAKAHLAAWRDR